MAKKLEPDYIEWVLKLNATQAREEYHKLDKANRALKESANATKKEMVELEKQGKKGSTEWVNLRKSLTEYNKEIAVNSEKMKEVSTRFDTSSMTVAQLKKRLKDLTKELNNTSKALHPEEWRKTEKEISRCREALRQAEAPTRTLWDRFKNFPSIAKMVEGGFLAIGTVIMSQVVGAFKNLFATIQDFERANSKLASVLGTTIDGVSRLTDQAKYLGRTTTATASEVTGLQTELAKLGFTQDVIEKLTPSVLKFAKAVDTDLSSAAAFAGAAMRMFNKDASEAEAVMASFAVATTKSALDFHKLEASLATVGPVANAFGFSLEETTALLGQLSNAGFDASSAATATRNILLNLADANGDLAKALGGPVTNLDELVNGLNKLNAEGVDLAKALELTDKRSVAAFSTFLNGSDSILALRDSITGCTGDFQQMAATMADNAAGSWAGFQSAVEGLILKFFDFREALKTLYEWGTDVVNWIGEIVDTFSVLGTMIGWAATAVGSLVAGIGTLVGWFTRLFTQTKVGIGVLNTLVVTIIAYKTAMLLSSTAVKTFITGLVQTVSATKLTRMSILRAIVSTKAWTAALLANPFTLVATALALLVSGFLSLRSATDNAASSQKNLNEVEEIGLKNKEARLNRADEMAQKLAVERNKINSLLEVAKNENIELERREKAVRRLNEICPEYNGHIDRETGALISANGALVNYIKNMEKRMKLAYYKDNYEQYIRDIEDARRKMQRMYDNNVSAEINQRAKTVKQLFPELSDIEAKEKAWTQLYNEWAQGLVDDDRLSEAISDINRADATIHELQADFIDLKLDMQRAGIDLADIIVEEVVQPLNNANSAATETVTRLKEINAELKQLRNMDPQSDEELDRIRKRIKLLQEEKKEILGNVKAKRTPGTYKEDSLDQVTAPVDDAHLRKLLEINKRDIPETERAIAKNQELIKYCSELNDALETLRANTDSTHTKTLDAITAEQNKLAQQSLAAQKAINTAMVKQDSEAYRQRKAATEAYYNHHSDLIRASVIADSDLQEASTVYLLDLDRQKHSQQLKELDEYYKKVAAADYYSKDEKTKLLQQLSKEMSSVQSQILTDTGKFTELMREAMTDTTSKEGITASFDRQRNAMILHYEALKENTELSAEEIVALETEKQRRIAALNYQYQEQMWQLQELVGLSWADEYDRELAQLENYHRQGLISTKDYEKKKLQLGVANAKKYFDYYANLSGSMFSAIQDAEIAASDAKYDVLIQQAKNNGADTAALEEEKENKKLEIQKKYADVNFAIKVSQIVADTAVAIMKAWADLGPIGGPIAAAIISATGVAQVVSAKAERDKIKNMQPGSTAGNTAASPAKAERVLSGYSDGGYTGDGDRYEVAGVVHRGEYVVPKPIMDNPRVVDAIGTIEAIRRNRIPGAATSAGTPSAGYADGGFTSAVPAAGTAELTTAVKELRAALGSIRAYVVYKDIERAGENLDRARAPFTRKR